jgi:outer membrane receptor protein involved in Fe transport
MFAQEKQLSKLIYLTKFKPYKSSSKDHSEQIYQKIKANLESNGFEVVESKKDLKTSLSDAKNANARFLIDGYYKEDGEGFNVYSQIYNPDTGYIVDALHTSSGVEGVEGIVLDPNESKKSEESVLKDFSKKLGIRIRTNTKRAERRENINDSLLTTNLGTDKTIQFQVAEENIAKASEDVFKILAEKETAVSVASNVIKDAKKQPVSISLISREQIKMSGARTLNELLTIYVPGFFTVEDQDDTIAGFRGFAPDNNAKVLMLINGHNMNTEYFWGPPDSIMNGLNLDYIERIEVIRGPGSVTLGQGALLGVVNIITKKADTSPGFTISGVAGGNDYNVGTLQGGMVGKDVKDLRVFGMVSQAKYAGQKIRPEGWAKEKTLEGVEGYYDIRDGNNAIIPTKDYKPGDNVRLFETWTPDPERFNTVVTRRNVATSGAKLKRANDDVITSVIQYKGLEFTYFYKNQLRDMYNFYRDRNRVQNKINHGSITYDYEFNEKISIKLKSYYTVDDLFLRSQKGLTLGGTREYRYGGSIILNLNEIIKNNNTAVGVEFRRYDLGQANSEGNNFLLNSSANTADNALLLDRNGLSPNERNRYVYPGTIAVRSLFAENFYKFSDRVDIFGAFRYDKHPYWGSNVAPRIGTLFSYSKDLRFRLSYQEGFRGVVGVSYAGGFEGDGHLRIQNFPYVQSARIPSSFNSQGFPTAFYQDIPQTKPEKMRSYEFATNYNFTSNLSIENIMFFNKVEKIIDVGVLYCDRPSAPTASVPGPNGCVMPRLGNDIPGNWNGYWFYKNNPGEIRQGGAEISLTYKNKLITSTLSQSIVKLFTASPGQTDSIYLTNDPNNRQFKGFPSNVTRWNTFIYPVDKLTVSFTYLYYPNWYSPKNQRVEGNHLANLGFNYKFLDNLEGYIMIKNLFNQLNLYPMISNAGGAALSDGSPAVERRTYWVGMSYTF